jgi:hypothetical protein
MKPLGFRRGRSPDLPGIFVPSPPISVGGPKGGLGARKAILPAASGRRREFKPWGVVVPHGSARLLAAACVRTCPVGERLPRGTSFPERGRRRRLPARQEDGSALTSPIWPSPSSRSGRRIRLVHPLTSVSIAAGSCPPKEGRQEPAPRVRPELSYRVVGEPWPRRMRAPFQDATFKKAPKAKKKHARSRDLFDKDEE